MSTAVHQCETCGGSGGQYEQTHATYGGQWWEPCPDCVDGLVDADYLTEEET